MYSSKYEFVAHFINTGGTEGSWTPVWKSSYDTFYTLIEHILVPDVLYSRSNASASLWYCQTLKACAPDPVPLIDADSQAVDSWGDRLRPIRQRKPILCCYLRLNLIFRFYEDEPSACLSRTCFPIESGTAPYLLDEISRLRSKWHHCDILNRRKRLTKMTT